MARLNKWADGMTDAVLKERETGDMYQRELRAERDTLRAELAALRAELQKVRSAAISGMDAATQHGHSLVQQAARLKAESNPDALESERAANALLTEQLQKAEAELAALRAERDALRAAGKDALHALTSSRVFVTSRERCHHPDGTAWYDERVERLRAALGER